MDYRFIISIFTCATLSNVLAVDVYSSPDSITVKKDEPYELTCYAPNIEIKGCLFTDPSGKSFILWAGATYEGGRVKQKGDGQSTCAVAINKAQDTDNGKWECQISTMDDNNNAVATTANVNVLVAVPPTTVQIRIADINSPQEYDLKMADKAEVNVECIAEQARPSPTFTWFLGDDQLLEEISARTEGKDNGKNNYIETLKYVPNGKDDGKILRCLVQHQAYTDVQKEGKQNEAEVLMKIRYPPMKQSKVEKYYDLKLGMENKIKMTFFANPKPTRGVWTINGTPVPVPVADVQNMYYSGYFEKNDGIPGKWEVELGIKNLSESALVGQHKLEITNEEGSTDYRFELHMGSIPTQPTNLSTLSVGIVITSVVIIAVLIIVIVFRAKRMFCFAS